MTKRDLPNQTKRKFLSYVGMETDLIFNHAIELPGGFASFPLLEKEDTRALLMDYAVRQIEMAKDFGFGLVLETATWLASVDRAPSGYDAERLRAANRDAVELLKEARSSTGAFDVLISGNIGPRSDGYAPASMMTVDEAREYHTDQIACLAEAGVDLISAYTMTYAAEAVGMVHAARALSVPIVVSLTVETDGRLPDGSDLNDAIDEIDRQTDQGPEYYMINCAHPDHFGAAIGGNPRLKGLIVNASRCSHAELDESETLDDGNPEELGRQIADLLRKNPDVCVFGGCCGTDFRHLQAMSREVQNNEAA